MCKLNGCKLKCFVLWRHTKMRTNESCSRFECGNFRDKQKQTDPFLDQLIYGFLNLCNFNRAQNFSFAPHWRGIAHSMYISTYGAARNFPVLSSLENARIVDFHCIGPGPPLSRQHTMHFGNRSEKKRHEKIQIKFNWFTAN